jgi:hypothetical protein
MRIVWTKTSLENTKKGLTLAKLDSAFISFASLYDRFGEFNRRALWPKIAVLELM